MKWKKNEQKNNWTCFLLLLSLLIFHTQHIRWNNVYTYAQFIYRNRVIKKITGVNPWKFIILLYGEEKLSSYAGFFICSFVKVFIRTIFWIKLLTFSVFVSNRNLLRSNHNVFCSLLAIGKNIFENTIAKYKKRKTHNF